MSCEAFAKQEVSTPVLRSSLLRRMERRKLQAKQDDHRGIFSSLGLMNPRYRHENASGIVFHLILLPFILFLSRCVFRLVSETIWVELIKDIAAETVADSRAATAYRTNWASTARFRSGSKAAGRDSVIDVIQSRLINVANQRRHFSAGMHFAVGQERDEVEGRPASVTCTASAKRLPPLPAQ